MAALLLEAGEALYAAAMGAADAEAVAVGAAEAAEAAAAQASAAAEAAAAAAEEMAAAESATVEAAAAAQEEAGKAAELEASVGARIVGALGSKIETALKGVLTLVKWVAKTTWNYLLPNTAIDEIPEKYRKVLAGMVMSLAATATKLLTVSYKYQGLSGGSEEGKQVAKQTKDIVDDLHTAARKLTEPSKVPINTETHEPLMGNWKQQIVSNKKELQKMDAVMKEVEDLMKEHLENNPPHEEGKQ